MPRREKKNTERNLRRVAFALLVFILILLMFYVFYNSPLFKIKNMEIKRNLVECIGSDEEIKKISGILNQNIILFNDKNEEENLKKRFYCIRTIILSLIHI